MNINTITNNPKETLISAAKRAVNSSSMNGKIVRFNFNGVSALVYPHEDVAGVITHVNKQLMIAKFPGLKAFVK